MALGICQHNPLGKVDLLPVFPLSFFSSLSNMNTVVRSTIEHFKVLFISVVALNSVLLVFVLFLSACDFQAFEMKSCVCFPPKKL
jgi:hypothetical protein